MNTPMNINAKRLRSLLELAREEDLGEYGDVTTRLLPDATVGAPGKWNIVARKHGRFCGKAVIPDLLEAFAPEVRIDWLNPEEETHDVAAGDIIARLAGSVPQMLEGERLILNILQHLSGVATLTSRFVAAVAGTHAKIYDTRKTMPGMRDLERYAVRCGGGHNHRHGLHDAVLIKDNHLAGIPVGKLSHAVFDMLNRIETLPSQPAFVEVECDGLDQVAELFKVVGIDVVLLDNFGVEDLATAVLMRDDAGLRGKLELEASGGASLETIRGIAETGVERVAVGEITHSAPILDLGLDAVS